jgi:hypothetical protein
MRHLSHGIMDADDIEEMLFGRDALQDLLEDATDDMLEDQLLDDSDDDEPLWELDDSPMLMTANNIDHEVERHIDLDTTGPPSEKQPPVDSSMLSVRDRYFSSSKVCS